MQAKIWNIAKIVTITGKGGVQESKVIAPFILDPDTGKPATLTRAFAQGAADSMNQGNKPTLTDSGETVESVFTLFNLNSE